MGLLQHHQWRWLRPLHWFHRLAGATSAIVVLVWFISGVVMVFHRYPKLDEQERTAMLEALRADEHMLSPAALAQRGVEVPTSAVLQRSLSGVPAYMFTEAGQRRAVSAVDGQPLARVESDHAVALARHLWPSARPRWLDTRTEPDIWTVHPKFRAYAPLHRVDIGDRDQHILYVSARTGEAVQLSSASERYWAYLGAIPHWVYFTPIRRHTQAWRLLVIAVSLFAMFAAMSGWALGLARSFISWRRSRFVTPFRAKQWFRLHHLSGLIFGPVIVTWLLSGAFSLISFEVDEADPRHPEQLRRRLVRGATRDFDLAPATVIKRAAELGRPSNSLHFRAFNGGSYYLSLGPQGSTLHGGPALASWSGVELPESSVRQLAARFGPTASRSVVRLADGDDYVFQRRHSAAIDGLYRIADANEQWPRLYVSAARAEIVAMLTGPARLHRWLYGGLHSLDLRVLYDRTWLWMFVILALLSGGLVTSVTATRLSTRSLSRGRKRRRARHRK